MLKSIVEKNIIRVDVVIFIVKEIQKKLVIERQKYLESIKKFERKLVVVIVDEIENDLDFQMVEFEEFKTS